jgi:hypothetical protein
VTRPVPAHRPSLVLVHSPVLGPGSMQATARALSARGWICVVPSLTEAGSVSEHVEAAAAGVPDGSVLVAHSGAGPLVPAIAAVSADEGRVVAGSVFVDARLPAQEGSTPMAEPAMVELLTALAVDGTVPLWSDWWGAEAFDTLVPEPAVADGMRAEMRALPLSFFRSEVPVPPGWPDTPCAYLRLSAAYDTEAAEAAARGWPVVRHEGAHLDVARRPDDTAVVLDSILAQLP